MAVSTTVAAIPSCYIRRPLAADNTSFLASVSVGGTQIQCFTANRRRLSMLTSRRITPKVEAKKQTFSSFDDLLLNADNALLVDFYADWCGPCQFMVPILEQVGEKLKDKIKVVKIDADKYTLIADRYRIGALPTFIIFRDGKPCDRFEGVLNAEQLIQRIENALKVPQ